MHGISQMLRILQLKKTSSGNSTPPGAPHFGGNWERLVRSCEKAMIAILDGRSLTDDVQITTMCLVEQVECYTTGKC